MNCPLTIELTPNGKTLVVLYEGNHQEELAEAILKTLGEPEAVCFSEEVLGSLLMLFPHQNLNEELMEAAERMTTAHRLAYLGFEPEGGFKI